MANSRAVVRHLEFAISTPMVLLEPFGLRARFGQRALRLGQDLQKVWIARNGFDAGSTGLEHRLDGGMVCGFPCDRVEHGKWPLGGFVPCPSEVLCDGQKSPDHLVNPGGSLG